MAENVVINIEANTQGLQSTIDMMVKLGLVTEDNAKKFKAANDQTMSGLNKSAGEAKKSIDNISKSIDDLKKNNGLANVLDIARPAAQAGSAVKTLKEQLSDAKKEAMLFTAEFGKADPKAQAAVARVAQLNEEITNLNKQIRAVSLEGKFQAIQNFGQSIGGVFSIATGALQAFGVESERATKLAREFQGALNIFQGLASLSTLADSFGTISTALGLTKTAATGAAAAMEAETIATEGAALANEGFAASMSATGIGAIVVILGALVAGMVAFADATDESSRYAKRLTEDIEDAVNAQKKLNLAKQGELDADVALRLARGQITTDEAARIKLQAESLQKYTEASREIYLQDQKRLESQKQLKDAEDQLARDRENVTKVTSYQSAQFLAKSISDGEERIKNLQAQVTRENETYNTLIEARKTTNDNYIKAFQANKIAEAKSTEETEKRKQESDKRTRDTASKKPAIDIDENKRNYTNALAIIKQFYDEQEILILKSGKSKEDMDKALTDNQIEQLQQQIEAAKANYQTYTDLEIQLQKLINQRGQPSGKPTKPPLVGPTIPDWMKDITDAGDKSKELAEKVKKDLKKSMYTEIFDSAAKTMNAYFDQWADRQTEISEQQLNELEKQESDLKDSYDNKTIGRLEYEAKQSQLDEKKKEKERQIKRDEDRANREKALFNVVIDTARMVVTTGAQVGLVGLPPLLPYIFAIAGAQAAAILAAPMPKYKKGTLSVPGVGNDDTHMALLTPGEAVIPKDTNKVYHDTISAIYHRKINADEINSFVRMKLKGDYSGKDRGGSVVAKMETSDLYALGRMMKTDNGVYIKNVNELASVLAAMNNPRR